MGLGVYYTHSRGLGERFANVLQTIMQFSCQLYPCGNLFQINHLATLHVVSNTAMAAIGSAMAVWVSLGARLERYRQPRPNERPAPRQGLQTALRLQARQADDGISEGRPFA